MGLGWTEALPINRGLTQMTGFERAIAVTVSVYPLLLESLKQGRRRRLGQGRSEVAIASPS
ncbi:MAG TPA: hypothetical protein V6C95_01420 [Coleofasciculaceae cyanobacterium]